MARRASAPVDSKLVGTVTNRTFKMFGGRRKHQSLMALSLIFYFLAGAALAQNATSTLNFDAAAEQQFVQMINQDRAQNGLPPLFVDERLTEAARLHTELMVQHSALSHRFPGEPAIEIRFSNQSLPSDREAENVALGQTVLEAHDALMQSPPHRQNILDSQYNVIGVGVIRSGGNYYVTEDFAHRLPQYSELEAESLAQKAINRYELTRGLPTPARKPLTDLRHMACGMALNDALDLSPAGRLPGVHDATGWTAGDPAKLPGDVNRLLDSGLPRGYALGACFAPSMSHPGGVYWLIMVSY